MMNKTAFLTALEAALRAKGYAWLENPAPDFPGTMLNRFMSKTESMIRGTVNEVNIDSESFVEAWRAIGGKGKPTYKGLRALQE